MFLYHSKKQNTTVDRTASIPSLAIKMLFLDKFIALNSVIKRCNSSDGQHTKAKLVV